MPTLNAFRGATAVFSDGSTLEFPVSARIDHLPPDPRYAFSCERWRLFVRQKDWTYSMTIPLPAAKHDVQAKLRQITEALATRAKFLARKPEGA